MVGVGGPGHAGSWCGQGEGEDQGLLFINKTGLRPRCLEVTLTGAGGGGRGRRENSIHCYFQFLTEELMDLHSGFIKQHPAVRPEQHGSHLPPDTPVSPRWAGIYPDSDGTDLAPYTLQELQVPSHEAPTQVIRDQDLDTELPVMKRHGGLTSTEALASAPAFTQRPLQAPLVILVI